jgi:hypothetical protein
MNERYRKALGIIWKADLLIATIFLLTLFNSVDNSINDHALLGAGFFVLLSAITYTQKWRIENRSE